MFQIISGLIYGLLGLLLAVPLLAIVITLVRELYSYDLPGLRGEGLEVGLNRESKLEVKEETEKEVALPETSPKPGKTSSN